jgi:hypothetical protein
VTRGTFLRRARQGKLDVFRPGKTYLASLSGVRVIIEKTRILPAEQRERRPTPVVPNSLGLTEMDLSRMALDRLLNESTEKRKNAKRLRDEERARAAPAHRLKMKERRRARARAKYQQKKAEREKVAP